MEATGKAPSQSRTEMVQIVYNGHINGSRRLFGGKLMEWIDTVGAVVARRHAGCEVTTAAVDSLRFQEGVTLNSTLVLVGTVTYTGRTSMEVQVETFVEHLSGVRRRVNLAYLVFVALDEMGHPTPVRPILPETEEEQAAFEAGRRRQELRRQRRSENY